MYYLYIGISKLCCGFCYKYLDLQGYDYRGTHGVCDQAWKASKNNSLEKPFKDKFLANAAELENGKEVFQQRRLSFDDFEKDIPIKLQSCINLVALKNKLNLIPESTIIQSTAITASYTPDDNIDTTHSNILINFVGELQEFTSQGL